MEKQGTPAAVQTKPAPYFIGGELWLDFLNTELAGSSGRVDLLETAPEVLVWLAAAGLLTRKEAQQEASSLPLASAAFLLTEALALRTALRQMVGAFEKQAAVPAHPLEGINRVLRAGTGYFQVTKQAQGYAQQFTTTETTVLRLLVPVAQSAAQFLCQGESSLVRQCANPACVLTFYDTTKNHRRRFCSPEGCGNRVKVAAHYRRRREAQQ